MRKLLATAALGMALIVAAPVHAADQLDLSVGLKTLPLLDNKITGATVMAIVYDPANAESKAEANTVKSIIDAGLTGPGGIKISSLMVTTAELAKLSEAKLAYVTYGLKGSYDAIGAAASSNGVLTMSTDLECVKANKCILGVVSKPSVEIYYSKTAADAAKMGFAQAFAMLVKQV
jgi:hypothetical protein